MPYEKPSPLDSVGLRTSKYKYFRAENNMNENVNLYDLKNDPFENNNIAKTNEELVTRFEQILMEMQNVEMSTNVVMRCMKSCWWARSTLTPPHLTR